MPETHDLLQSIQGLVPRIDDVLTTLDNAASAWTKYHQLSADEFQAKKHFNQVSGEIARIHIELSGAKSIEEKSRTLRERLVSLDDAYQKVDMRWKEIVDELTSVFEQTIEPTHELVVLLSYEVIDALRSLPAAPPELRTTRDEIERLKLSEGLLTDLRTDGGGRKHAQLLSLEYRRRDLLNMKCRLTEMERLISGVPASEPSIPNPIRPHPPAAAASTPNKRAGHRARPRHVDKRHQECAFRLETVLKGLRQHGESKEAALRQWLDQHQGLSRTQVTDYLGGRIKGKISKEKRAQIEEAILHSD